MKQKKGVAMSVAERFDLPYEALARVPRLTVTGGNQAIIENHHGLVEYSGELIEIDGGKMKLSIRGYGLEISSMTKSETVVIGKILSVEFS